MSIDYNHISEDQSTLQKLKSEKEAAVLLGSKEDFREKQPDEMNTASEESVNKLQETNQHTEGIVRERDSEADNFEQVEKENEVVNQSGASYSEQRSTQPELNDLIDRNTKLQKELERMRHVLSERETLINNRLKYIDSARKPELSGSWVFQYNYIIKIFSRAKK